MLRILIIIATHFMAWVLGIMMASIINHSRTAGRIEVYKNDIYYVPNEKLKELTKDRAGYCVLEIKYEE